MNLSQKQVALLLDTSVDNIRNWESARRSISLPFRPRIIQFTGYCPYDASLPSVGLKLKERRENFGLPIKILSGILNVDPCTIAAWERNTYQPSQRYQTIIEGFLKPSKPDKLSMYQDLSLNHKNSIRISMIPIYVEYDSRWTVGRKIAVWRTSCGISHRELAKLAGVCFQSIVRWEKEQRMPKPKYLKLIRQAIISNVNSCVERYNHPDL